jgi:hypothetical protein
MKQRRFQSSNPECGKETVINPKNTWLPPRCMYCRDEIDWEGIFVEKSKICLKCGVEGYTITANFCVFHENEKIPLQEKEYRKQ